MSIPVAVVASSGIKTRMGERMDVGRDGVTPHCRTNRTSAMGALSLSWDQRASTPQATNPLPLMRSGTLPNSRGGQRLPIAASWERVASSLATSALFSAAPLLIKHSCGRSRSSAPTLIVFSESLPCRLPRAVPSHSLAMNVQLSCSRLRAPEVCSDDAGLPFEELPHVFFISILGVVCVLVADFGERTMVRLSHRASGLCVSVLLS